MAGGPRVVSVNGGRVEVERPDGTRIPVARAGLSPELAAQADSMTATPKPTQFAGLEIDTGTTPVRVPEPMRSEPATPAAPVAPPAPDDEPAPQFVDPGAGPQTPALSGVQPVQYATRTQRQVERQVSTPDYLKAVKEQQEAEAALGDVAIAREEKAVEQFAAQAQLSEKAAQIEEAAAADRDRVRRERAARVQAKLAERDKAEADFASTEIDPDRGLWVNKSAPAQIAAAIGLALSGVGSALSGQENLAMKVLDGIVERDIQAQRANMEKKRVRVEMLDGAYARMRQAGLDDDDAADAARVAHLRVVDRQLAQHELAARSDAAKVNIQGVRAEVAAKAAATEAQLQQSLAGKEAISSVTAPVGGGGAQAATRAAKLAAEIDALDALDAELAARDPGDKLPGKGNVFQRWWTGAKQWFGGGSGMSSEDTSLDADLSSMGLAAYVNIAHNAPNSEREQAVAQALFRGDGTFGSARQRVQQRKAAITRMMASGTAPIVGGGPTESVQFGELP